MSCFVTAAQQWLGTPFHLNASIRHVGTDCYGFVSGVWHDVTQQSLPPPPYLSSLAHLNLQHQEFLEHLAFFSAPTHTLCPGTILIFQDHQKNVAHGGILINPSTFIHVDSKKPAVVKLTPLSTAWQHRIHSLRRYIRP
jgi:cell wall-associated NlpC family hydrolase